MSRFYARYVPPTKKPDAQADAAADPASNPDKRKREEDVPQVKKNKKLKTSKSSHQSPNAQSNKALLKSSHTVEDPAAAIGKGILDRYRVTEATKSKEAQVSVRTKRSEDLLQQDGESLKQEHKSMRDKKEKKEKKKEKREKAGEGEGGAPEDTAHSQKHAAVLSKFEKAKQQEKPEAKSETVSEQSPPELHGLEPIPQPEQLEIVSEKPTYSVLPQWQENPLIVPLGPNPTFSSLGLSEASKGNLKRQGIEQALPIQATVLPLLLNGPSRHSGDLCVSAATGSGKTLSYVLPIIADLEDLPGTKLRAVIVVPTRELVKQVRELCEACAAGTSLKFANAVGSKSLTEERELLVREEKIYDPQAYVKWQQSPVDWSNFSLTRLVQTAKNEDPLDSVGYVTRYTSRVDVLITTPGRLVDHLRSTPGFSLEHVTWLVVDEADRLLNESYQEWVAVVKPALESQAATQKRDELLRYMRLTPPKRKVTKVLLSATMTRDLSKLNALGLYSPKLVVLGGANRDDTRTPAPKHESAKEKRGEEVFHLPDSLKETVIPIPDGSEKPLFLLELVRNHIGITANMRNPEPGVATDSLDTGSESGSTSESSSDSEDSSSEDGDSSSSNSTSDLEETSDPKNTTPDRRMQSYQHAEGPRALIFTRSTASAERLSRLLSLLDPLLAPRIATLTRSTASSASSRRALASFRSSKISVLIATDRASRGLDVPGLEHVISYDVPNSPLTYVHRVGRTARAGRVGQAWTLVEHREGAWFWREVGGKGKHSISETSVTETSIQRKAKVSKLNMNLGHEDLKRRYEEALKKLGDEVLGK